MTWAHHALLNNDRRGLKWGLLLTVVLGVLFTALPSLRVRPRRLQVFAGHIYGATFFMATGFHGAHVIIGTLFLTVCFFRALAGHFTPKQHFGFEAAAWYWHFVDVVWLFLFTCIYVIGRRHPRGALRRGSPSPRTSPTSPCAPTTRGEGRGEGTSHTADVVSGTASHPSPVPASGERESGCVCRGLLALRRRRAHSRAHE